MIIEKKLIIGIGIVSMLIDRYDDTTKDSAINDDDVIKYCKDNYYCNISNIDFEEMVDTLNRTCSRKNFIQKYTFSLPSMFNRIISTECRKEYLENIKNQLEKELEKLSDIF